MAGRAPETSRSPDLRRLKWIAAVVPIAFVWLYELVRFQIVDHAMSNDVGHIVSAIVNAAAVIAFALLMFFFLERAQRLVVRQNRELTAVNAIQSAVQGALSVDEIVARALQSAIETTGALGATALVEERDGTAYRVTRYARPGRPSAALQEALDLDAPAGEAIAGEPRERRSELATIDIPLDAGGASVGHLRLALPAGSDHAAILSRPAVSSIGGQIATAIQLSRRVADLRRRERETQALYRLALQLSRQAALDEMLNTIVHDARELLACERAVVCLADRDGGDLRPGRWTDRLALADDGSVCVFPHPAGQPHDHPANPVCPMRLTGEAASWLAAPLRSSGEPLGELCVVRTYGGPFGDDEQELLAALADLASIAVSTSRMHEAEQQWLILRERDRIAREMHDSLAQVLGAIHLRLRQLHAEVSPDGLARLSNELRELAEVADEAYRDVREAILGLRESISPDSGLLGTLREYVRKYSRQSGIDTRLLVEGDALPPLPPASEVQLLRVVQEALTNVRKHADASTAIVRIEPRDGTTAISVEDDGVGFDPARIAEALDRGFGVQAMRERVEQIGGTLEIHSASGKGTRVVARLPTEHDPGRNHAAPAATAHPHPAG